MWMIRLAQHYYPGTTTTGVDKVLTEENVKTIFIQSSLKLTITNLKKQFATKTLKLDQVKLNISSIGMKKELIEGKEVPSRFLFPNAISLTEDVQIVLRFNGNVEQIHKTFDFVPLTISPLRKD
jgi:hypothetical protein